MPIVLKCGRLNLLERSRYVQTYAGIALPFTLKWSTHLIYIIPLKKFDGVTSNVSPYLIHHYCYNFLCIGFIIEYFNLSDQMSVVRDLLHVQFNNDLICVMHVTFEFVFDKNFEN